MECLLLLCDVTALEGPHRERFGYGGDPLGCGEAGLSMYDWSTFYAKRVRDFNDAQRMDPVTGKNSGAVLVLYHGFCFAPWIPP
jgi:hypothetical protein